jgi:hypothetical protein
MPIELASPKEQDPRREQPITRCASDRDGDCTHPSCPQNRDSEPHRSGRSCPLWIDPEYS